MRHRWHIWAIAACAALLLGGTVAGVGCGTRSSGQQQEPAKSAALVLGGGSPAKPSTQAEKDLAQVAADTNAFTFDLFGATRPEAENSVSSPYVVSVVLSMAMAGSGGETEREFGQVLHLGLGRDRLFPALGALDLSLNDIEDFTSAAAIWGQTGQHYEQAFVDLLGDTYGAPLRLVDFMSNYGEAAKTINQWVNEATHGQIQTAVDPNGPRPDVIVLMLTSAAYMKAEWEKPFPSSQTSDLPFHLLDGPTVQVPTMHQVPSDLSYMKDSSLQAVELPYADGRLSFVIILPEEGQFSKVGAELSARRAEEILAAMSSRTVTLQLPRFTFSSSSDLIPALKALGLRAAFSSRADFSGISSLGGEISGVGQEAFILVDEAGTEAAASATVTIGAGVSMNDVLLPVNRPFYFLVRDDETGAVLFLGQVTDPREAEQLPAGK